MGSSIAPTGAARSAWHSPVPYLFGGLAAMLGLIAFALLILACSYWKLSAEFQSEENGERDLESGGHKQSYSATNESVQVYEEKILVIMAGDQKPTFLATPKSTFSTPGPSIASHTNLQNLVVSQKSDKEMDNPVP